LTPPPVAPGNLLHGHNQHSITSKALALHLAKSIPTSAPRASPFKIHLITLHPNLPLIAYVLEPEGADKKNLPKSVIVQHIKTRAILWTKTIGELASTLFDYDVLSKTAEQRQHKLVKDLGQVQRLEFFDPSTLYWSGHGASSGPQDVGKRWSYLLVQLQNRLLIVNLRQHSISIAKPAPSPTDDSAVFQPILAHITQESLGNSLISSNAVPVTQHNLIIGTTDGTLKLYDWKANVVIQSIKVLQTKNDSIVHILSTNKYGTPKYYSTSSRRFVCLTKKGAAYLMALQVTEGIVHDISPPMAKFEGGTAPASMSKQDDDYSTMEHLFVQYCAFRDLLLWSYPARTKAKLLVWALGSIPEPDAKQRKKGEPIKIEPTLVLQFPYETTHTIFPGWFHESVPMESMTCAAVTKEGDFQILVAPLYNSGSTFKNPFCAVTVLSVNLNQVLQRDLQLPEEKELHIKVHSVYCPALRDSSIFYFGTNIGILLVRMVDGNTVPAPGSKHAHLSANVGSLGKAVLTVKGPEILYGSLEPAGGPSVVNPIGAMESKNNLVVYESPPPLHLPPEIHKRPVRLPPCFLASASRNFLCCFWKEEMRYEVLNVASMLERVTTRSQTGKSPVVASGNGISSFAWVGDDDVFCLLYNPEQDLALKVGIDLSAPTVSLGKELANMGSQLTDLTKLRDLKKLKDIASMNAAVKGVVGTAGKLKSLKGLQDLGQKATVGTFKGVTRVGVGTMRMTGKVALGTLQGTTKVTAGAVQGTAKLALGGTMKATMMAVGGTKNVLGGAAKGTKVAFGGAAKVATFGLMGRNRKAKDLAEASSADAGEEQGTAGTKSPGLITDWEHAEPKGDAKQDLERKHPWVELRALFGVTGADGSVNTATLSNLGQLNLRSGNRNPPCVLFGGPVLCVGSKSDENDEGLAYFYTRKKKSSEENAADYVSSGPAFPCPDVVAWDDDGRLCAVVIQSRVSIYLSDEPEFIMLGTTRLGSSADVDVKVISVRFIHGALYCTTRSSVQCIFLGDLEGGVCHLDAFTLASSDVPVLPSKSIASEYNSLTPPTIPMPLSYPSVLGYQNGALIISTVAGVQAIPLGSPLLRIGSLIAAGHHQKAELWFDAVAQADHETLATFLERRGVPDMALQLAGISLETTVDLCMRFGFVDRLEEVVDLYGLKGLRAIDMSRGVSANIFGPEEHGTSVVVCVGAYLLAHGKVELVRRLATECLGSGEDGKREAFVLASLLLSVDGSDSKRVIQRAVEHVEDDSGWLVGNFVRDHVLSTRTD
jgi:hypothetical protein